ncbi:MDR family MFS transporter [Thermogemmatispora onikobensis]|uniref:MDR family MFS transporter n=1 Tax=Thermogemmatispora onikobensis TaxID=732234 RepID=UPI000852EC3B|nr:MDR family MFS transporter [Thermogemmatispora onikobensis]
MQPSSKSGAQRQREQVSTSLPRSTELFSPRQTLATMSGLLLVLFLAILDQTIVATALPRIGADLGGFEVLSWITTGYLLASTVTIPIYGKLSDLVGRKPILLASIGLFLIGSALSGLAQSLTQLIIFRTLQGLGAGGLQPVVSATVGDLFAPRERGKWMGITGGMYALGSIIGPLAGGWLTDRLSWRWIFSLNVPIGLAALLVLIMMMPELRPGRQTVSIDYAGVLLLTLGTIPLLLAFSWAGNQYPWLSPQIMTLLGAGLVFLCLLVIYEHHQERRGKEPILEPSLFVASWGVFGIASLVTFLLNMALLGSAYFIPLFAQGVIGTSATNSGLITIPLALTAIGGAVLSGLLLSWSGRYRWLAIGGALAAVAGSLCLVRLNASSGWSDLLIAMLVLGFGMGTGQAIYTTIVQNALPQKIGQATAALAFFRQLGGTLSIAILGGVLSASYTPAFQAALPAALRDRLPASVNVLFANPLILLSSGQTLTRLRAGFLAAGSQGAAAYQALVQAVREALASSLHQAFLISFLLSGLTFIAVWFLQELPLRSKRDLTSTGASQ